MRVKVLIVSVMLVAVCASCRHGAGKQEKLNVIFETDAGNDVDDALALDMAYKYMDAGKLELLAVMCNKKSRYSAEFVDVMNSWYGYPDVPVGVLENGADNADVVDYARKVCEMNVDGVPAFARTITDVTTLPAAPALYRKLLAQQPDASVTIVSVGFSTNVAQLLDTEADAYSPLDGKALVAAKVKLLAVMAGSFGEKPLKEFNIINDIPAAAKLFAEWPTRIVVSPFELGREVKYPAASIENDFEWGVPHPAVEAYKFYQPMPYDRETWDLTALLHVAEPDSDFMTASATGVVTVDNEGYTHFRADSAGRHVYLTVTDEQAARMQKYFVGLISRKPYSLNNKR